MTFFGGKAESCQKLKLYLVSGKTGWTGWLEYPKNKQKPTSVQTQDDGHECDFFLVLWELTNGRRTLVREVLR